MTDVAAFVSQAQTAIFTQHDGTIAAFVAPPQGPYGAFVTAGQPGATGPAARQGLGVSLAGGPFQAGQLIDLALLADPETLAVIRFFSRSGVEGAATFAVLVDDVQVATAIIEPDALPTKQSFALSPPCEAAADAVVTLRLPDPASAQLTDFLLSIGS